MATIKIKPTHPSQGDFVVIEEQDFDAQKHELLDANTEAEAVNTEAEAVKKGRNK